MRLSRAAERERHLHMQTFKRWIAALITEHPREDALVSAIKTRRSGLVCVGNVLKLAISEVFKSSTKGSLHLFLYLLPGQVLWIDPFLYH